MIRLVVAVVGCALVSRISLQPSGNNRQKVDRIRNTYYYRKKSETTMTAFLTIINKRGLPRKFYYYRKNLKTRMPAFLTIINKENYPENLQIVCLYPNK